MNTKSDQPEQYSDGKKNLNGKNTIKSRSLQESSVYRAGRKKDIIRQACNLFIP